MCVRNCEPALRCPQMVRIPFTANQNQSVFCANTKRTGCAWCPFHALGVLCSPQVRVKLIWHAPLTRCTRTAHRVSDALVYTKFKVLSLFMNSMQRTLLVLQKCRMHFLTEQPSSPFSFFLHQPLKNILCYLGTCAGTIFTYFGIYFQLVYIMVLKFLVTKWVIITILKVVILKTPFSSV